ncbi:hypothetical protein CDAR_78851 [Caerostris darwini]|uniref:Uncharacterized protein n=1 Tax=Caerostris darwini TaxID=1538125 RepID=A0AAV4Q6U5_9ARAC|nr:hypothetical protein CDAR_78851 [Caerostris darwini]
MRGESVSQERGSQPIHELIPCTGASSAFTHSSRPRTKNKTGIPALRCGPVGRVRGAAHPRTPEVVQLPAAPTLRRMSPVRIVRTLPGATCVLDPCRSKVLLHFFKGSSLYSGTLKSL